MERASVTCSDNKGLPFEVKAPNKSTRAVVRAAKRGELKRTSLKGIAREWEAACAKSSKRRSSRKT
jgi:hypothetical protein